ncbi:unnamed protein product [Polarella glacialis]|uniref:Amino acid transporter transmembrane domain-containing protein n=1 Tax=Polarella glacialis TaxID=89957 RepID=A0A813L9A4_POLGL|nr:unnamed protein product [Polarella glacialis]
MSSKARVPISLDEGDVRLDDPPDHGYGDYHSPMASPLISWRRMTSDWTDLENKFSPGRKVSDFTMPEKMLEATRPCGDTFPLDHQETGRSEQLSFGETLFNLTNTLFGSGVLGIPYAFRLAGYLALPLLALTVVITAATAVLLGEALDLAEDLPSEESGSRVPRQQRDFVFLSRLAFGKRGELLVGLVTGLEVWTAMVTFLVMSGVNAASLLGTGPKPVILAFTLLASTMVAIPMRAYASISLVALTNLLVALLSFCTYLLRLPDWAWPALVDAPQCPGDLARAFGLMIFCFAGHPVFPGVHQSMRDKKQWRSSVSISFLLTLANYGGLGLFAYLVMGPSLNPCFTLNIAHSSWARRVTSLGFAVKIQLTVPLLFGAVIAMLPASPPTRGVRAAIDHDSLGATLLQPDAQAVVRPTTLASRFCPAFWPSVLTAVTALSACLLAGDVAALASLCGSLLVMLTSVFFPVILYLRLKFKTASLRGPAAAAVGPGMATLCAILLAFGAFAGVSGTYFAVLDLGKSNF